MKKTISIRASKEKVWKVLLNDEFTRIWYAEFSEGTHAETDWKVGSKAVFADSSQNGIIGKIIVNRPNELLSIKYDGVLINGIEDYESAQAKAVKNGVETYKLSTNDNETQVLVEGEGMVGSFMESMSVTWDKALQKIKSLAETGIA